MTRASRFFASDTARLAASRSSEPDPVTGNGSVISSGRPGATRPRAGAGVATVTSPAPDTSALVPERRAAPVLPTPPAATRTCPKVGLLREPQGGRGLREHRGRDADVGHDQLAHLVAGGRQDVAVFGGGEG